jgi:hypothetical protein
MSTQLLSPCRNGTTNASLERTRFYARQLVTPEDLTQDQIYFREKFRRHNRMLHGWGVVCGACVRRGKTACEVIIEPGYILGPWGDEIVLTQDVKVDICKLGSREQIGCCDPSPLDPWCGEAKPDCPAGTLYLAIRYEECQAKPVRASHSACGCGCDDSACEYSRIRDGYAVALLRELPPTYTTPMQQPTLAEILPCVRRAARPCPPCPESPWVILADLAVDRNCNVRAVDCFAHRRGVVSFASFYLTCSPQIPGLFSNAQQSINISRTMSAITASPALIDMNAGAESPRAMVTMTRPSGEAVPVPAFFSVQPGETLRELLEREGNRTLYDPFEDKTITLRELYASADVPENTRFDTTAAALAPLEGRALTIRDR